MSSLTNVCHFTTMMTTLSFVDFIIAFGLSCESYCPLPVIWRWHCHCFYTGIISMGSSLLTLYKNRKQKDSFLWCPDRTICVSATSRSDKHALVPTQHFSQCAVALIQLGTTRCRANTQHAVTLTQLCTTCRSASAILQVSQSSRMSCPEISDCGCWNM